MCKRCEEKDRKAQRDGFWLVMVLMPATMLVGIGLAIVTFALSGVSR